MSTLTFLDVVHQSPMLDAMRHRGASAEEMVVELWGTTQRLRCRIEELESIAPKRIEAPDGKVYVWHCPNELIPTTKIDA